MQGDLSYPASQRWRFLVVRDPKIEETVGALYKRAWGEQVAQAIGLVNRPLHEPERFLQLLNAAEYFAAQRAVMIHARSVRVEAGILTQAVTEAGRLRVRL
jgi:nitroreductase